MHCPNIQCFETKKLVSNRSNGALIVHVFPMQQLLYHVYQSIIFQIRFEDSQTLGARISKFIPQRQNNWNFKITFIYCCPKFQQNSTNPKNVTNKNKKIPANFDLYLYNKQNVDKLL